MTEMYFTALNYCRLRYLCLSIFLFGQDSYYLQKKAAMYVSVFIKMHFCMIFILGEMQETSGEYARKRSDAILAFGGICLFRE